MVTNSVGDMAGTYAFRLRNVSLKQEMQRLSTEMTTGKVTDTARKFSGDLGVISGIDSSLARLKAYATQTNEAAIHASTTQTSLGTLDSLASRTRQSLMTVSMVGTTAQIAAIGSEGKQNFEAAVSALNTSIGGRSLFSGVETSQPALLDGEAIMTLLDGVVAGLSTGQSVADAVSDWFDDPAGFAAQAYQGGATLAPAQIAPGETANLNVTATDPAIIATLKGMAIAALINRGAFTGQSDLQRSLALTAGTTLDASQTPRLDLAARVGLTEAQIEAAQTRNSTEQTALQITRNDLTSVDQYETATKLQESQTQLETIYALTARLSRLSLMDYL